MQVVNDQLALLWVGSGIFRAYRESCGGVRMSGDTLLARWANRKNIQTIGGPKARHTHPQRKNFKARAKLTTLQISMLPSSQPSELKVVPSNMTLRMASIKGVSGRIRR